ncbi:MAG: DUF3078 domain-containing protein [Bacteroidota bacterium]
MNKVLLQSLCLMIGFSAYAQDGETADTTYWRKSFKVGLNFNQASFSDEWTGGGVNSIGLSSYLNYKANYRRGVHTWDNEVDFGYGVVQNQDQNARKALDRMYFDTKYGRRLSEKWNLFTSLSFLSQFAIGYSFDEDANGAETRTKISNLFAPAFVTSAIGFEYKPVDYFSLRIAPMAPRFTIVADDDLASEASDDDPTKGQFGVDLGDNVRSEWSAFQLQADFDQDIAENLNLKWKYLLFINYEDLELDRWDHRLDLTLSAAVNSFLNVSLGAIVIYDFDQVDEVQLSQQLTLGLAYAWKNFKGK